MVRAALFGLASVLAVAAVLGFYVLLGTPFYMYYFFIVLACLVFLLARRFGIELYILLGVLPIFISPFIQGIWFHMSVSNEQGTNPLKISVTALIWLVVFCLELAWDYCHHNIRVNRILVLGLLVILCFMAVTFLKRGGSGMSMMIENYISPITFVVFFSTHRAELRPQLIRRVALLYLTFIFLCLFLSVVEYLLQYNPMDYIYERYESIVFNPDEGYRIRCLLGAPLSMSRMFLKGTILAATLFDRKTGFFLGLILSAGIMMTGSRAGLIFVIFVLLYSDGIKFDRSLFRKLGVPLILLIVGGTLILSSPIGQTILHRFTSDSGSADARVRLIEYFFDNAGSFNFYGLGGFEDSVQIFNAQNQTILMEIPWIMLYFDVGPVLFAMYLLFMYWNMKSCHHKYFYILLFLSVSSYNSFGVKGTSNFTLHLFTLFFIFPLNQLGKEKAPASGPRLPELQLPVKPSEAPGLPLPENDC